MAVPRADFGVPEEAVAAFDSLRSHEFLAKADINLPDDWLRSFRTRSHDLAEAQLPTVAAVCRSISGPAPCNIEVVHGAGTFHHIYRVHGADGRALLRLCALPSTDRDLGMLVEARVAERVRAAGLPVPRVRHVDVSRRRYPIAFNIIDEVLGVSPEQADNSGYGSSHGIWPQLGALVAHVHSVATRGFGPLTCRAGADMESGLHPTWAAFLEVNLARHLQYCLDIGAIVEPEAHEIEAVFAAALQASPGLLHGDLGSHNILCHAGSIVALLDWEDSLSGDPVYDIANWGTFNPDERLASFLAGYSAVRSLPSDFDLRYWTYFLRISLAKTVHRHRFGYSDPPDRPRPSLRIQKALARLRWLQ